MYLVHSMQKQINVQVMLHDLHRQYLLQQFHNRSINFLRNEKFQRLLSHIPKSLNAGNQLHSNSDFNRVYRFSRVDKDYEALQMLWVLRNTNTCVLLVYYTLIDPGDPSRTRRPNRPWQTIIDSGRPWYILIGPF